MPRKKKSLSKPTVEPIAVEVEDLEVEAEAPLEVTIEVERAEIASMIREFDRVIVSLLLPSKVRLVRLECSHEKAENLKLYLFRAGDIVRASYSFTERYSRLETIEVIE